MNPSMMGQPRVKGAGHKSSFNSSFLTSHTSGSVAPDSREDARKWRKNKRHSSTLLEEGHLPFICQPQGCKTAEKASPTLAKLQRTGNPADATKRVSQNLTAPIASGRSIYVRQVSKCTPHPPPDLCAPGTQALYYDNVCVHRARSKRVNVPIWLGSSGSLDQVITVDGGGDSSGGQARSDELQDSHLSCGILHSHPICSP
jgi:hypothetical protein